MRALVTGGAGFIGSHIVDRLLVDSHQVVVLDDFSTGKKQNLPEHNNLQVITGDVGDFNDVDQVMDRIDWVFHHAAVASVPKTINDPFGSHKTNYLGTLNVLEAAKKYNVKKVIFAASAAAYGDLPGLPKEEYMPVKPLSPYAVDKLASENICQVYHRLFGVETVCLRYFNVYGPRQDPSSPYSGVISVFSDKLRGDKQVVIYGDGEQTRDFVNVADVVDANIKVAISDNSAGEVFNIATGQIVTLNKLLSVMCEIVEKSFKPVYEQGRDGDIKFSSALVNKANQVFGWMPVIKLEKGLGELLGLQ